MNTMMRDETLQHESTSAKPPPPPHQDRGEETERVFKCILLGDPGVGKTCLARRVTEQPSSGAESTLSPAEVVRKRVLLSSGVMMDVELWDTAGQERFRSLTWSYYRGAQGVLVVYDKERKRSLGEQMGDVHYRFFDKERSGGGDTGKEDTVVFLVATKADLADGGTAEGWELCENEVMGLEKLWGVPVEERFWVSSKTGLNVDEMIRTVADRLWKAHRSARRAQSRAADHDRVKLIDKEVDVPKSKEGCGC